MRLRPAFRLTAVFLLLASSSLYAAPPAEPGIPQWTADLEFFRMAEALPGFGGLFYDQNGRANVYLTDTALAPQVKALAKDVRVLQGKYDFRDLFRWRGMLRDVLAKPDVVLLDIDEQRNRLRIGVDEGKAGAGLKLQRELAKFRVPPEAVIVESVPRVQLAATLTDRLRPVQGGVQIAFPNFLCTLGFNANRSGVAGFVTNSHCSGTQGGVQNTIFFQNTNASGNRIGIETVDPFFFSGGSCPAGRVCRFSDSAFASYDTASTQDIGKLARPSAVGSLTISSTKPFFNLVGTANFPTVGQVLNKVGRTTGWTRGTVSSTCVDVNVANSTATLLCQSIVNAAIQGGDSGSPVFSAGTSDADTTATLYGVLWGCLGSPDPFCQTAPGTQFVMSPWQNIQQELGSLATVRTTSAVNGASFVTPVAPDSIASAFGNGLATTTANAPGQPLPTSLAGTTVKVRDLNGNEILAPLFFVSPTQVNFLLPGVTATGATPITITSGDGTLSTGSIPTSRVAPGLFSANSNGQGVATAQIVRVKSDGSQIYENTSQFDATQNRWVPIPISFGPTTDTLYLVLYGTGIRNRPSLSSVTVQVGSEFPPVFYAGAQGSFVGEDQVNAGPLPRSLAGGQRDIVLTVVNDLGITLRSNTVTITFQ